MKTLTQQTDDDIQDESRGNLDVQARLLYGLIHARWIVTARGLTKMVRVLNVLPKVVYLNPYRLKSINVQNLVDAHA